MNVMLLTNVTTFRHPISSKTLILEISLLSLAVLSFGCRIVETMVCYKRIRMTARPAAEIDTSVPMQYFMTSYFAASS